MSDVAKIVAHAWSDRMFKQELLRHPAAAMAEHGVKVQKGITVKVIENTDDNYLLVLPVAPDNASELSIEELEKVAEGFLRPLDDLLER